MKKWLIFFFSFTLLVLVSFCSYLYLYRAEFLSSSLTRMYGTPVKVAKVHVSKRGFKLQQVEIFSPTEFTMQPAASIKNIEVRMALSELFPLLFGYRSVEIRSIAIEDPYFAIETHDALQFNWTQILSRMAKNFKSDSPSCSLSIGEVSLSDISVDIKSRKNGPRISHIELSGIKRNELLSTTELLFQITKCTLLKIGKSEELDGFCNSLEEVPLQAHQR